MLPEMDDFNLTLRFPDTPCSLGNDNCGESVWTLDDGTLLISDDNRVFAEIECRDPFIGPHPAGKCFQFCHFLLNEDLETPLADPLYAMISEQTDGTLFWSMQQGMLVSAVATLTPFPEESSNGGGDLGGAAIAGIVVGCLCGAGAIASAFAAIRPLGARSGQQQPDDDDAFAYKQTT
jgi:hypothetical protein